MIGARMSTEKRTTYTPAFKEEAVRLYLEGGRSDNQLGEDLGALFGITLAGKD